TFGSLFAGIGGIDLGLERSGMNCAWQVENNHDCNRVLEARWPNLLRRGNVRKFRGRPADLICGGFPCQDLSVAGRRAGLAGKRSGLWFQFHRIIAAITPHWVLVENVPGLLSSNGGQDMATILRGLAKLRYGWAYRVLDARHF